jgi:hypothetical protein
MGSKTYIDKRGYRRFNGSNRLVHRWVAEKKLGRKLRPGEVVHHKNGNKLDNRPQNLKVMMYDQHEVHHKRYRTVKTVKTIGKIAVAPLKLLGDLMGVNKKKRRRKKKKWF